MFLIAFPTTISRPEILDWIYVKSLGKVNFEETDTDSLQQEKMMDLDYCEEYLRKTKFCIKQNIIVAMLRKANSHLADICRLIKNQ